MNLEEFTNGWIVGDFTPTLVSNKDVEVAIKKYKLDDCETRHVHKIATEYTVVVSGKVKMNNKIYSAGDVVEIKPGVSTDFLCLEDSITVVIKTPSVVGDKYFV
jgi:mannose-6-phosphate isomerase-like protein (cupin superfamily)